MRGHLRTLTIFMMVFALFTVTFAPVTAFALDSPLADTIPGGTSTAFAGDPYTVIAGQTLAISTTTTFPDLSGVDTSIYEDGLVTLDKPFDSDVVLTLKYNGAELGTHTLTAGETSFWVSNFGGVTPRQPLRNLSENSDPFTIEAAIPDSETGKSITVTIRAIAATADNFDNEANWVMVLASDTATVTVTSYLDYLKSTIPTGTTTAFDKDSYSVIAGNELTIGTSTTVPDLSSADPIIYEDGRVTLDKPFANDVVFTLKYGVSTIGTYTLEAGDKSVWVSELSGVTPRQRLNALVNQPNGFSVVAAIPAGEPSETVNLTIEALAVYSTGNDVIQVLASDTAAVTITSQADVEALADAKTAAHDELNEAFGYFTEAYYSAANWAALTDAKAAGDAAIDAATTIAGVDAAANNALAAMSAIPTALDTLPEDGAAIAFDQESYAVTVGKSLTITATTVFPDTSNADPSLYEDGLVALADPQDIYATIAFDQDITFTGTYSDGVSAPVSIGTFTLPAGDDYFFISQFSGITQRQLLKNLSGHTDVFTLTAIIPDSESNKVIGVIIMAVVILQEDSFDLDDMLPIGGDIATVTISPVTQVTGITLSGPTKMNPNTSRTITANVLPANATNNAVTWSSSNTSVATVDNGVVTALKTGTVIITATAADGSGKKGTRTITVTTDKLVAGITISGSPDAGIGKTITLVPSVTPANARSKAVTWSSLNTSIATVDRYGRVTGKAAGFATIRATAADGSAIFGELEVTVKPAATKVTISGAKIIDIALADKTIQLETVVEPAGAASTLVTWSSSSTKVATVDQSGKVTGIKAGTVTITATARDGSGKHAHYTVTVATLVNSVTIGGPSEVATGKAIQLTYSVLPTGATNKSVTWSIPAEYSAFATVSSTGLVTAKTVTVDTDIKVIATAKDNNKVASLPYDVTVMAAAASLVDIYNGETKVTSTTQKIDMFTGVTLQLTAKITPAGASQHAAWSTSSSSYATVDANGLVTFKKAGTVTIYATARDGSGKKAYVTFKVSTLVHTIAIGGPTAVAQGKKIRLTTSFNAGNLVPTNKLVKWTSSDTKIATVSSSGIVSAAKFAAADPDEKTVTITATAQDGTGVKGTYDITVKKNGATSVDITYDTGEGAMSVKGKAVSADLTMKDLEIEFSATVSPSDKASKGVVWSSSRTKVVTVVNGVVRVVGKGTATITVTATDGTGVKATFTITVVDKAVSPVR